MTELAEGLTLGTRFRLISRLGEGGMSEVWLAHDAEREQDVALKILDQELARQQGFVELLKAECEKAGQLRHPNIVRVYSAHAEGDLHFISMEYIPGPSLKTLRGADWQVVLRMLLPLTEALEYAHNKGVVHRDIKPANVLLDASSSPHLTDFGVSSLLTAEYADQVRTGGSLPSMSPQQVEGASPGVGDDVYGFGALVYDLLTGAPLFHPDVSRDKVLREVPPRISELVTHAVPASLDDLVAAMLAKDPVRRPLGMNAVRAVLEDVLEDAPAPASLSNGSIQAVARRSNSGASTETFQPRSLPSAEPTGGGSRNVVYAGFGLLFAAVLAVIFLLPGYMADRNSVTPPVKASELARESTPPAEAEMETAPEDAGSRQVADQALADLLGLEDSLAAKSVQLWGGADWVAARELVTEGDEFYKDRLFGSATDAYRAAFRLMEPLEARADSVLATALVDGATAFAAGNQMLALERFDLALAIDGDNAEAKAGQARALQLDKVLTLMDEAAGYEMEKRWAEALQTYARTLEVDSSWPAALEGRARVDSIVAGNEYLAAMSSGYAALAAENYSVARREFNAALQARPGDSDAQVALAQIDSEQRLARIIALSAEADTYKNDENWPAAAERYQQILNIDSSVVAAKSGLETSSERAELDTRLRGSIKNPDKLAADNVWDATRELLTYARGAEPQGPRLSGQISELDRLLTRARIPVAVEFQSDNLTDVVIYKVGRLGSFASRNVELRPGSYTAVGVRKGYRDVRTTFRVVPEDDMQPIILSCEDPI
jgi:serine/threonine protein kinase